MMDAFYFSVIKMHPSPEIEEMHTAHDTSVLGGLVQRMLYLSTLCATYNSLVLNFLHWNALKIEFGSSR